MSKVPAAGFTGEYVCLIIKVAFTYPFGDISRYCGAVLMKVMLMEVKLMEVKRRGRTNAPASMATSPPLPSLLTATVRPAVVVVFPHTNTARGATAEAARRSWLYRKRTKYSQINGWLDRGREGDGVSRR